MAGAARWTLIVLLVIGGGGATGRAAPAPNRVAMAKKHFLLGEGFYKLGKFAKALAEYEKALSYKRYPALLFNIAQCHRFMDQHKKALFFFKLFLVENPKTAIRSKVLWIIGKLEKKVGAAELRRLRAERNKGRLTLVTEPKGAEVRIDQVAGKPQAVTPTVIKVKAGQHLVMLSLKGYRTAYKTVKVPARGVTLVKVKLESLVRPRRVEARPPPKVRRRPPRRRAAAPVVVAPPVKARWKIVTKRTTPFYKRWWFWTGLLAGTGLILTGSYFGVRALDNVDDWERTYQEHFKNEGKAHAAIADVMLFSGGAMVLGVIIGAAVVGKGKTYEKPVRTTFAPSCGTRGCGLWVRGSF